MPELFHDEAGDLFQELLTVFRMDLHFDGFGQVQTEDTHDGFAVDVVSAGDQVNIEIVAGYGVDKVLYVNNGVQQNGFGDFI